MIDKIINMFGSFVRLFAKAFLCIVISVLLYASVRIFWPFMYKRTIYDLGDKYLSWEWVSYSDTTRMVIVSKDGKHRVVTKWLYLGSDWKDIYFKKEGMDTVFFPGWNGKEYRPKRVIEATDVILEYSTGTVPIWGKDLMDFRTDYGGFERLFTGEERIKLKQNYRRVTISDTGEFDNPTGKTFMWLWPLQNPLLKQYPFSKESRESGTYR
jgi:hypothetical protein